MMRQRIIMDLPSVYECNKEQLIYFICTWPFHSTKEKHARPLYGLGNEKLNYGFLIRIINTKENPFKCCIILVI